MSGWQTAQCSTYLPLGDKVGATKAASEAGLGREARPATRRAAPRRKSRHVRACARLEIEARDQRPRGRASHTASRPLPTSIPGDASASGRHCAEPASSGMDQDHRGQILVVGRGEAGEEAHPTRLEEDLPLATEGAAPCAPRVTGRKGRPKVRLRQAKTREVPSRKRRIAKWESDSVWSDGARTNRENRGCP